MTTACNWIARPLHLAALAMVPGSLCAVTPARADTRVGVDVSAGGSFESNPYLTNGGSSDIAGSLRIVPWLALTEDVSSIDLSGDLLVKRYIKNSNGTNVTGSASMNASHRFSPYFSISGGASYSTSRDGINLGFANVGPNDPLPPPTTPLPDISLGGTRTRTHSMSANLGVSAKLSALDQFGANFSATRSTYGSSAGRDFNYLNTGLNYSRTLSERLALTLSVRYGNSDYTGTRVGDGTIISPQAGVEMTVGPKITLSASLGVSLSRSKLASGATLKSTSLSGEARICRRQIRGAICLTAMRGAQPTALGSINSLTSISLNYSTQLSERDNLSAGLTFNSRNGSIAPITVLEAEKYYTAEGTWSHSFGRRFSMYVAPSYTRISSPLRSSNRFQLSAGLRYSFGDRS